MNHRALTLLVVQALALGACEKTSSNFCPDNPNDNCLDDAGVDSPPACSSSAACAAPTPVCDLPSGLCVQCTPAEPAACAGATPVCGDDLTCRGCAAHTDCPDSAACLPDGACADPADVAYVSPSGTVNASCDRVATCTPTAALATARPYVKFAAGTTDAGMTVTVDDQDVTMLAEPGAVLTRTNNGLLLEVRGSSVVSIYDLAISGASGSQGIGISLPAGNAASLALVRASVRNNQGTGIAASGGSLTLSQSTIANNTGGGIAITGAQFDITNCLIVKNGGGTSTFGGLKLDSITGSGTRRLDFNTITANQAPATVHTGVACGTVLTPLVFSNNIIYANLVSGGGAQLGGSANCAATYSDIGPDPVAGAGNINVDPRFVDALGNDFHLQPDSPARDAADSAAALGVDIDGEPRPQGLARDMGADEVYP